MTDTARLFIALWPDVATVARLHALPVDEEEPGVRRVAPEKWHVTLRFVGDAPVDLVAERLAGVVLPAVHVRLGPTVERLDSRQLVVPAAGVDTLAGIVRQATAGVGAEDARSFRGHLTIARTPPGAASSLSGAPFDGGFDPSAAALVASEFTPDGSIYTTVASFPLVETETATDIGVSR